jgi:hypothetical protein
LTVRCDSGRRADDWYTSVIEQVKLEYPFFEYILV